jgi:hypothetical protein
MKTSTVLDSEKLTGNNAIKELRRKAIFQELFVCLFVREVARVLSS